MKSLTMMNRKTGTAYPDFGYDDEEAFTMNYKILLQESNAIDIARGRLPTLDAEMRMLRNGHGASRAIPITDVEVRGYQHQRIVKFVHNHQCEDSIPLIFIGPIAQYMGQVQASVRQLQKKSREEAAVLLILHGLYAPYINLGFCYHRLVKNELRLSDRPEPFIAAHATPGVVANTMMSC